MYVMVVKRIFLRFLEGLKVNSKMVLFQCKSNNNSQKRISGPKQMFKIIVIK